MNLLLVVVLWFIEEGRSEVEKGRNSQKKAAKIFRKAGTAKKIKRTAFFRHLQRSAIPHWLSQSKSTENSKGTEKWRTFFRTGFGQQVHSLDTGQQGCCHHLRSPPVDLRGPVVYRLTPPRGILWSWVRFPTGPPPRQRER